MAASRPAGKAAKAKEREKAAKAKEREKAAKAKEREKAAKAKEREKAAKAKEREKAAKAKEREKAAKAKEREKAAKAKEREKAAKAKEREKAAKAKEREKAAKAKQREKAAKAEERQEAAEAEAAHERPTEAARGAVDGSDAAAPATTVSGERVEDPQPAGAAPGGEVADELSAGDQDTVPDGPEVTAGTAGLDPLPEQDTTVRQKGYLAEALGKEELVDRSTQRATVAASYTTRDHDLIRAWAESRGGRPADVTGTGRRGRHGAGVLRIEFPDGPGDDSALEAVDWASFFATFDDSDVDFLYQERVRTGGISRFHKFVRAGA